MKFSFTLVLGSMIAFAALRHAQVKIGITLRSPGRPRRWNRVANALSLADKGWRCGNSVHRSGRRY